MTWPADRTTGARIPTRCLHRLGGEYLNDPKVRLIESNEDTLLYVS
jgi:hypothetical protein